MGMVVRTNTMALNAYRQLGMNNNAVAKSLEKLSSGFRINRAGDDAAGLAISEKMKAQITGLETASANAQDGISLIQTAEGNLTEVHSMLNRMVELSTKSANGTYTITERKALQDEVNSLLDEINRISQSANFNGTNLLDGSLAANNALSGITTTNAVSDGVVTGLSGLSVTMAADHKNSDNILARQDPEFTINLVDFKYKLAASNADQTVAVTMGQIGGQTVTFHASTADVTTTVAISFTQASGTSDVTYTAGALADLYDGKVAVIGNDVYTIAKDGTEKLKFTYAGQKSGNNFISKNDDGGAPIDGTSPVPTGDVSFNLGTATTGTERYDCHLINVKDPIGGAEVQRSGAKLTLTQDIIDRGSLKIGDTTFTFDNTKEATDAATPLGTGKKTGAVTIGTKGLTGDALLQSITEQMSHCTIKLKAGDNQDGDEYTFNVGRGTDKKTIEIEEQPLASKPYGQFTETQLKKAFSQTVKAANAKAEITLAKDADGNFVNVSAGNSLTIGDTTYTFSKDNSDGNNIKIGATAAETFNNIKAKLTDYNVNVDTTNDKMTIERKSKTPTEFGTIEYNARTVDNGGLTLQIGDTADSFNKMTVAVEDMSAAGLGLNGLDITTEAKASNAIDKIKTAINTVSTARAGMGALQNRLEHTINNLDVAVENLSAANSRIRDTDMAKEMMNYTKMNVLVQSAQAMLAQANQQPQSVLQLLQ